MRAQAGQLGRGAASRITSSAEDPHPALRATFSRTGEGVAGRLIKSREPTRRFPRRRFHRKVVRVRS